LTTSEKYAETVQARFAKIGATIKDASFRDALMKGPKTTSDELAKERIAFLRATNQTALLKHAKAYTPIPHSYVASFMRSVETVLMSLADYGIHLGPTSFAASVLPKRGLIFWDFFPVRRQEAASLYPARPT